MGIAVNGVVRVTAPNASQSAASTDNGATSAAARIAGHAASSAEIDPSTQQPKPLRFPWLSRITSELEPAAKQKPAFPSAPPLGENLDQAV